MDLRERAMARLADEQHRLDVARRRAHWKRHQKRIDPCRLVFIDETTSYTRGGQVQRTLKYNDGEYRGVRHANHYIGVNGARE